MVYETIVRFLFYYLLSSIHGNSSTQFTVFVSLFVLKLYYVISVTIDLVFDNTIVFATRQIVNITKDVVDNL